MLLRDKFKHQGNWLFQWRSYLPLVLIPIILIALRHSEAVERDVGDPMGAVWEALCVMIAFIGLLVRCITIGFVPSGTSGRNTDKQRAHTLNTMGMYSIVRNPLYLGNFIIIFGLSLFVQVWWFSLITILLFWLHYERIIYAEEEFLCNSFGSEYLEWAEKTPVFLPKFSLWQKPDLSFSFRTVLKKEYSGFFALIVALTLLEVGGDLLGEGKLELDLGWMIVFSIGLIIYLTLRILTKKTRVLYVKGR